MFRREHTEEEKRYFFIMKVQTCYYSLLLFPLLEESVKTTQLCYPKQVLFKKILNKIIFLFKTHFINNIYSKAELHANVLYASIISKPLCKTKTDISVLIFIIKILKVAKYFQYTMVGFFPCFEKERRKNILLTKEVRNHFI